MKNNSITDVWENCIAEYNEKAIKADGLLTPRTGLKGLDEILVKFEPGEVVLVGGVEGIGTTAFVVSILASLGIEQGVPTVLFSLKKSSRDMANRLIAHIHNLSLSQISRGKLSENDRLLYEEGFRKMSEIPIYIEGGHEMSPQIIEREIKSLVRKYGVKVVIIDGLLLMTKNDCNMWKEAQELSQIMRMINNIAKKHNVTIIVTSNLNREKIACRKDVTATESHIPQITDFAGCNDLATYSDITLLLHRPAFFKIYHDETGRYLNDVMKIFIVHNRDQATGDVEVHYSENTLKVENYDKWIEERSFFDIQNPFLESGF